MYAFQAKRPLLGLQCVACQLSYLGAIFSLWRWAPAATAWTLVAPHVISSLALMFGNWSQHIFVNPACPGSSYGMAYTCTNCPDNMLSYNDGYHVEHHLNSQVWTWNLQVMGGLGIGCIAS